MRGVVVVAIAIAACKPSSPGGPGTCLELPGATRKELLADPAGHGLYWLQDVAVHDSDGSHQRFLRLYHHDFRTGRTEGVRDHIGAPLVAMGTELLGVRFADKSHVVIIHPDGILQELTPPSLDVLDFEPIDDHTIAFLAEGEGPRAVFTLDIRSPHPKYIGDADVLLDVWEGRVYTREHEHGVSFDLQTGARSTFLATDHTFPLGTAMLEPDRQGVSAYDMRDGSVKPLLARPGPWRLVYSPRAILARTPPKDDVSQAVLLTPGGIEPLPTLVGGTTLLGVASVDGERWGLVAHNISNYIGDPADNNTESEVCQLPNAGQVTFKTRLVPKRYIAHADKLFELADQAATGPGLQIFDGDSSPPTLRLYINHRGGSDFHEMRELARQLHRRVTNELYDREVETQARYVDERSAVERWIPSRRVDRTFVGMGDALLADPDEYELVVRDRAATFKDGKLRCSGIVQNSGKQPAHALAVHCIIGEERHVIAVPDLEPAATYAFDQAFEADDSATATIAVYRDGERMDVYDTTHEATMQKVFDVATAVYDATGFALEEHSTSDGLSVNVHTVASFASLAASERERLAKEAFRQFSQLRTIYDLPQDASLVLTINVDTLPTWYRYDGDTLKAND